MSSKIWQVADEQPGVVAQLTADLNVPAPIAQAMINRVYDTLDKAKEFI